MLIALTAALIALVVWKATQAISGDPVEGSDGSDRASTRPRRLSTAARRGAALASLSILIANWGGSAGSMPSGGGGGQQQATGVVMGFPDGRWIVMIVGLAVIAFGAYEIYKEAFNCEFMERIGSLEQNKRKTVEALGRAGYAGRRSGAGRSLQRGSGRRVAQPGDDASRR